MTQPQIRHILNSSDDVSAKERLRVLGDLISYKSRSGDPRGQDFPNGKLLWRNLSIERISDTLSAIGCERVKRNPKRKASTSKQGYHDRHINPVVDGGGDTFVGTATGNLVNGTRVDTP